MASKDKRAKSDNSEGPQKEQKRMNRADQIALTKNDNILIGAEDAPEIFVDGYQGVTATNGAIKLNFFSQRFDPERDVAFKKMAAVICLSPITLLQITHALSSLVEQMKVDGVLTVESASGENSEGEIDK